jgi:hypothetical protein|tara:strand:- start:111 stop:356 length:246 start_codon:yes stop_codon:yes gene_type:complete
MNEETAQIISDNECLIADGLDHAIIGVTAGANVQAVYSCALIVQQYMIDGMEAEEALEYLHYNVLGGIPGADNAPVFLSDL